MQKRRAISFIVVGLVAGLALGSLGIALGATASTTATQTPGPGGWGGPGGGRGFGRGHGGPGGGLAQAVATLTGLTVQDVMTQRQAGKSFAAIAKAKGVSADKVVAEAVKQATADLKTRLAQEVTETATGPGGMRGVAPTGTPTPGTQPY
jgi:hypothetical protein